MRAFSSDPATTCNTLIYRAVTDGGGQCIAYGSSGRKDLGLAARIGDGKMHRDSKVEFGPNGNGYTIQLKKQ